jgi:hypothetical protein
MGQHGRDRGVEVVNLETGAEAFLLLMRSEDATELAGGAERGAENLGLEEEVVDACGDELGVQGSEVTFGVWIFSVEVFVAGVRQSGVPCGANFDEARDHVRVVFPFRRVRWKGAVLRSESVSVNPGMRTFA